MGLHRRLGEVQRLVGVTGVLLLSSMVLGLTMPLAGAKAGAANSFHLLYYMKIAAVEQIYCL